MLLKNIPWNKFLFASKLHDAISKEGKAQMIFVQDVKRISASFPSQSEDKRILVVDSCEVISNSIKLVRDIRAHSSHNCYFIFNNTSFMIWLLEKATHLSGVNSITIYQQIGQSSAQKDNSLKLNESNPSIFSYVSLLSFHVIF